jgi:hypothetical protein
VVELGISDDYPESNLCLYKYMMEGLKEVKAVFEKRGVYRVVLRGSPPDAALELVQYFAMFVCDRGYLKQKRLLRDRETGSLGNPLPRLFRWSPM